MQKMILLALLLSFVCLNSDNASGKLQQRLLASDDITIAQLQAKIQAIQGQYVTDGIIPC